MNSVLFLTLMALLAALVTAIMNWPRSKPKSHDMDSAETVKRMFGGKS